MKLSVIGPTYPYKGGISHFTTLLVRYLREKNEVQFISWKRQYPAFLYPVEPKDTSSKNKISEPAEYILDFVNPVSWFSAFQRIKKEKPDLLIITWITPIQSPIYSFITTLIKKLTKIKVMFICHNVLPHEKSFYDNVFIKLAFKNVDSFIVHSVGDGKILEKIIQNGSSIKNNKIIINGFLPIFDMYPNEKKIDVEKVKKQLKLNKHVLLFFGYIRPYKGLKYLLNAMPKILKNLPDTSLLVVGEFWSKDKQSYLDLIKKLNLGEKVVIVDNYVPNEEIGKYFAVSDVAITPYVSATQSAIIQTAYAFSKPVISTPVGGLKDVVEEGISGYFCKPQDSDDIADKVKLFFRKPIKVKDIVTYRKKFEWKNYSQLIQV